VQAGCDAGAEGDGQVLSVGEVDADTPNLLSFDDHEQGARLRGSIVLRSQSLAYLLDGAPVPGERHDVVLLCHAPVLAEYVAGIGHPLTVRAAAVVGTKDMPPPAVDTARSILAVLPIGANRAGHDHAQGWPQAITCDAKRPCA
jgi:hypothetical protein